MAHPTLDFLRLVLVCHCHAPRASRLGGWLPATTLCVTPLPRPAEWVAVRPLELRLFSLSGSPMSCIEGHRYAGLAFVQGSIAREPVPGDSPSSPRAALLRSLRITRARLVRRSSFAVFESPVTRDKTMCSGRPIKMIIPARLPSLVLVSFVFHLVAPALVYGDYSSSERYLEPYRSRPMCSRSRLLLGALITNRLAWPRPPRSPK